MALIENDQVLLIGHEAGKPDIVVARCNPAQTTAERARAIKKNPRLTFTIRHPDTPEPPYNLADHHLRAIEALRQVLEKLESGEQHCTSLSLMAMYLQRDGGEGVHNCQGGFNNHRYDMYAGAAREGDGFSEDLELRLMAWIEASTERATPTVVARAIHALTELNVLNWKHARVSNQDSFLSYTPTPETEAYNVKQL